MSEPPPLPPPQSVPQGLTFEYDAQTPEGERLTGHIEAADGEQALLLLKAMHLRVVEVSPTPTPSPGKPIHGQDFAAFNQQLAQLAAAGLPIEQGLRLIAADLRRGRLARTVEQLAAELEKGTPLDQAFHRMGNQFPPLYGRLIAAGVKSGNLSAVLLNLGRHLETVARLKNVLWRTISYPLFVLIALGFLLVFLGIAVLPQFQNMYAAYGQVIHGYGSDAPQFVLPWPTALLIGLSRAAPVLLVLLITIVLIGPIVWAILRRTGRADAVVERLVIPMPLIGPVLRSNLVARWCDAARLGVEAGLDLPAAFQLAADATGSPRLSKDSTALIDA
ncbi:MAG TPA: type II secretion system F family protein, partial [Tepidisphaeraceae bacterium]|nr:type II secretion system F family protein [Tepidisphaeraceae bacterium]